tara:strand:- start:52 stop:2445 length:2394 start_codon:yes stop_codon:yes gene_type:complete
MNEMEKQYDEMNFEDLFNQVVGELNDEKDTEETQGVNLLNTTTISRVAMVKSQKAKSFLNYINKVNSGQGRYSVPTTELILLDDEYDVVLSAFNRIRLGCESEVAFLRACPENPRHGVLESIEVCADNLEVLWNRLRNTMIREDPNGCLMLQPFIPASSSMVMVPNVYAWIGPDHDGVTAGKEGVVMNYLMNPNEMTSANHFAEIGHQPNTYELEYVYQKDDNYLTEKYAHGKSELVQIRGSEEHTARGPPFTYNKVVDGVTVEALSKEMGAVPNGVGMINVKHVWETKGLEELAYLEEHITKEKMPKDFVISHPNGSLGSHVYAHCRAHGIPYIVAKVNVGETWVEGSNTWVAKEEGATIDPQPYNPFLPDDLAEFNVGLERSRTQWRRQQGWFAHYFHQWMSGMNMNPKHNARLSGAFTGWLVKAAVGLCFGELRHSYGMKKDLSIEFTPALVAAIGGGKFIELHDKVTPSKDRKHYYLAMEGYELTYEEMELALRWCGEQFKTGWSGAFGGKKWSECAFGAADLALSVRRFMNDVDEVTIRDVVANTNKAENFAHNNGSLYNKFLEGASFDYATFADIEGTTGWFAHDEKALCRMFKTYEVTRSFIENTFETTRPVNDWKPLFSYLLSKKKMDYKHTPITGGQMYKPLRDAALSVGSKWLHHNTKYTLNDDYFIPCGSDDCEKCVDKNILTISLEVGSDFTSMLLSEEAPSAFFALDHNKSSVISYTVAQMIKQKKYDEVEPQAFVDAWNGMTKQDPMYKILSGMMKKHLKKMIVTNVVWSNEVTKIMSGVDVE